MQQSSKNIDPQHLIDHIEEVGPKELSKKLTKIVYLLSLAQNGGISEIRQSEIGTSINFLSDLKDSIDTAYAQV